MLLGKVNKQLAEITGIRNERRQIELHDLTDPANSEMATVFLKMFYFSREDLLHVLTYPVRMCLIAAFFWLGCVGTSSAASVNQPMTGATAPGWVIGGSAYLTASNGTDPVGNGWLRLTDADPAGNEAGFGYYNSSFSISQGAVIQYDYATWGGTGADGYSIYLFNATSSFSVGASGGSLGYAQKTVAPVNPGMAGGYIGIGIDEYGNFCNPTEGRIGGPGFYPNEVSVRGPYNNANGAYYYLGGSGTLGTALGFNGQDYRPDQTSSQYRHVVIYLTPVAAPNYLQIDVYVQFGFGQPLTPVATGLYAGAAVPANVMVGYAASTGGSTNYHEIRNLIVSSLPTQSVDLGITKTVSSPTVAPGGAISYSLTATNLGPSGTTVTGATITDTVPSQITGVTWTCAASGTSGSACGAASGSGNTVSTTATLPFNGVVTYTVTGTVSASTTIGTVLTNTASVGVPSGYTDYNADNNSSTVTTNVTTGNVTVSGTIYNDANHDGSMDNGETGESANGVGNTYYVQVYNSSNPTTMLSYATVAGNASTYTLTVPAYGTYTVILSTSNSTYTPSVATSGDWTYTSPVNFTNTVTTSGSNVTGLNFGIWNGAHVVGKVINDNGAGGTSVNANDGVQNGTEAGIAGVTVKASSAASGGGTLYDTETTDANGNFTLYIPSGTGSGTVYLYETLPSGYMAVNFNAGTTAGTYSTTTNNITFAYTKYTSYTNVIFSNVLVNTFTPTPLTANGTAGSPVYYAHTFTPLTGGSLALADTRTQTTWAAVVFYLDATCSGTYQSGDTVISGSVTATAGVPICILVMDTIASGATVGLTDKITTTGTFTYTNSPGPVTSALTVIDTTTVVASPTLTVLESVSPSPTATPGQILTYTILVTNTATGPATNVSVTDTISPYTSFALNSIAVTNGTPASGLTFGTPVYSNNNGTTWTYTPVSGGGGATTGYDGTVTNWQIPMSGTMSANGANFTITFKAQVR
jgi:uncharacterized repeat protein (TIGR01451 family)